MLLGNTAIAPRAVMCLSSVENPLKNARVVQFLGALQKSNKLPLILQGDLAPDLFTRFFTYGCSVAFFPSGRTREELLAH